MKLIRLYLLALIIVAINTISINASASYFFQDKKLNLAIENDSVKVKASDSTKAIKDTLIPLFYKGELISPLYPNIIAKKNFTRTIYKDLGEILSATSFSFIRDMGGYGLENEFIVAGFGVNDIAFLENNLSLNERVGNYFKVGNFQTEYIDSIEVLPLSRGFLYSVNNLPITFNLITRDNISPKPYTRMRYFQGAQEEGFIDAIFSAYILPKTNFSFNVTNSVVDQRYLKYLDISNSSDRTAYSSWLVSARLRYLLSNKINLVLSFDHQNSYNALSGGLNLEKSNSDITDRLDIYDEMVGSVLYKNRTKEKLGFNYSLKLYTKIINELKTEINFYYRDLETYFRQKAQNKGEYSKQVNELNFDENLTTAGLSIKQSFDVENFNLDALAIYEKSNVDNGYLKLVDNRSSLNLGGIARGVIFEKISLAIYAKYLVYNNESYVGLGGDIKLNFIEDFWLTAGMTHFAKPFNIYEEAFLPRDAKNTKPKIYIFNAGLNWITKEIESGVSIFYSSNSRNTIPAVVKNDTLLVNEISKFQTNGIKMAGVNINFNYHKKIFMFNFNSSLFTNLSDSRDRQFPEFAVSAAAYYVDTLFNSNLKLKAGFRANFFGIQNYYSYDFIQNRAFDHSYSNGNDSFMRSNDSFLSPGYNLNFEVNGVIQDMAIVYFKVENIFGKKYMIVPGYPAPPYSIRFGVAWEFLE